MRRSHLVLLLITIILLVVAALITTFSTPSDLQRFAAVFLIVLGGLGAIAEISGLLEKLGVPELILPNEPRYIEHEDPYLVTVALWGPSGSGKSWLIQAFARALHTRYGAEINGLKYSLEEIGTDRSINNGAHVEATIGFNVSAFRFERRPTKPTLGQLMSSFRFRINVYDDRGWNTISILDEHVSLSNPTLISLASADVVLLALDPLVGQIGGTSELAYYRDYAELVGKIFSVLEKSHPGKDRLYAACITKVDQIFGGVFVHPNALVEIHFGPEMLSVLKTPKSGTLDTFTTSAFGFLSRTGYANYDPGADYLIKEDEWQPYGVEFPFFWAFEKRERQCLEDEMRKTLLGRLTMKLRLSQYIPYPKPKYDI